MAEDGMQRLHHVFESAGLAAPPVPMALRPEFRERGQWFFATRDMKPMAMYMFDDYLAEAIVEPVADYVAVCHAGHGMNSYAITYHLVLGPLALFVQTLWGGVYVDAQEASTALREQFDRCTRLIKACETSPAPLMDPPGRLVVAQSGFRERSVCAWLPAPFHSKAAAHQWLSAPDPISAAITLVEAPRDDGSGPGGDSLS